MAWVSHCVNTGVKPASRGLCVEMLIIYCEVVRYRTAHLDGNRQVRAGKVPAREVDFNIFWTISDHINRGCRTSTVV